MSNSTSSQRTGGRLGKFDINDLKCIKVAIRRSNIKVNDQAPSAPILRGIDEPERLIKIIHYRSDEGSHPIFDRDDIIINKSEDIIEKWVCKCGGEQKLLRIASPQPCKKDTNHDRHDYYTNKSRTVRRSRSPPHKSTRYSRSPQPSTSTHRYDMKRKSRTPPPPTKEYRRRRDRSFEDYRESKKSPRTPDRERKRSRSPAPPPPSLYRQKNRYSSRSPVQSRHLREVKRSRSRSPPSYHHRPRRRSRSRERRYSRSPTTSRRIARYSPHHHRSRSRSPTKRVYTKNVQIPPELQYYPGEEYWIPGPLAPRYLPRGFVPPAPPPPGMYPRVPGMMAPRPIILPTPFHPPPTYRQRYPIYNNRTIQPQKPKIVTNTTTVSSTESCKTSAVTASSQDATTIVVASSSSCENIDDKDKKTFDADVVVDDDGNNKV